MRPRSRPPAQIPLCGVTSRSPYRVCFTAAPARRLHRVVIETMGADEPEYLERKSRTHEIMKRRGIVLEHRVSGDTRQGERDDAFFRRVGAQILGLAGMQRLIDS